MKQLILNSGGFDSVILLHEVMKHEDPNTVKECLFFDWGQVNKKQELEKAQKSCDKFGIPLHVITIPSDQIWKSVTMEIQEQYIPMRNMVFLSIAVAFAEKNGFKEIFLALIDPQLPKEENYPDCTIEFIDGLNYAIADTGIMIYTPFIDCPKTGIGRLVKDYNISKDDFFSCNTPTAEGKPCGQCNDCKAIDWLYNRINEE